MDKVGEGISKVAVATQHQELSLQHGPCSSHVGGGQRYQVSPAISLWFIGFKAQQVPSIP